MSVFIQGRRIQTSSMDANGGIFIGQNIQNGWDSMTPQKVGTGYSMGDFSATPCGISIYGGSAKEHQGIYDDDLKGYHNRSIHR